MAQWRSTSTGEIFMTYDHLMVLYIWHCGCNYTKQIILLIRVFASIVNTH